MALMKRYLMSTVTTTVSTDTVSSLMAGVVYDIFSLLLPMFLVAMVTAFLVNLLQAGFVFSFEPLSPKWSKIDPIKGLKRLFSLHAVVELLKNVLKILIIGLSLWLTMDAEWAVLPRLVSYRIPEIVAYVGKVSFKIVLSTCWILVVLAVLDFLYQRWEHNRSLKMTKQEVKEEYKQLEGDPLVKGRIRRIQREWARKRMMAAVPKADVVITNPTHYAIAIRYEQETMAAPLVLAKGADYLAEKSRR